jgi:phosphoribosylaminoimidazolecarboxamide formyltransferase/IMP cyclohydrolase
VADTLAEAYQKAHDADPVSIYGGVVALNRPVDELTASKLNEIFLDIIIAPEFTVEAQAILKKRKNLRLLAVGPLTPAATQALDYKRVAGGLLVQNSDLIAPEAEPWQVVTTAQPSAEQLADLRFAWQVVKFAKSNAIVVAKDSVACGIGTGQVNRIDAAVSALERSGEQVQGAVLASDGLFPFPDVVEAAAKAGISAIVQPGGSIRDKESIEMANAHGIAMVCTGYRHFRH